MNKKVIIPIMFILPALIVYFFYFIAPIPTSLFYSFFQWDGLAMNKNFIGFRNWIELFQDKVFWKTLVNNFLILIISLLTQIPIGLGLGVLINSKLKGMKLFQTIYFIPLIVSTAAVGIIWRIIYNPQFGFLNNLLEKIGLRNLTHGWLGEPSLALPSLMVAINWQWIPFYMTVFAAAISGIPQELYEAAEIDGATPGKKFIYITLPSLRGTIRTLVIFSLIGSLKAFDHIYIITGGGPGYTTEVMATYMYKQAFTAFRLGYASTIAVMMFLITFILAVFLSKFTTRRSD